ncbi:MAG: 30S ribosomal protein S2 [Patescibacteria group bacterium]
MKTISLEALLEAGCHFGHQVSRQNPKAREFIFEARDGIHIIDLEKTKEGLEEAAAFIKEISQKGGNLLIVGTKKQAVAIIKSEKERLEAEKVEGVYFVTKRWIGGTLTNFSEVSKNYRKLKDLTERLQDSYEKAKFTKKEVGDWEKSRQKLEGFYGSVSEMPKVPDVLFIIDTHQEQVAAKESRRAGIPTVGITDTNSDPTIIDYPIPANDDAVGSLELLTNYIVDAWIEGKKQMKDIATKKEAKEKADAAKAEAKEGEAATAKKKETASTDKPAASAKPKKADDKKEEAKK